MHRVKKTISVGLAVLLIVCTFSACFFMLPYTGYKGEFPALYTVAVNSLLAVYGYHSHGDALLEPIEEDSFGRVLFSYHEDDYYGEGWPNSFSYLICQKTDETYAYYYPDYNFIIKEWNGADVPFSKEEIDDLKSKNDWEKELDEKGLTRIEIARQQKEPEEKMERKDFTVFFQKTAEEKGRGEDKIHVNYVCYLTSDTYGRAIYYASGGCGDPYGDHLELDLAIIFNPDGSYKEETCILELTDLYHYQDDLKEFKELNNWNRALE